MSTCCPSSSQHYASDLAHLLDANGLLFPYTAPALSDSNTSLGHDYELLHALIPEGWRAGCAHLSRGPTGIWYMRLRVPAALRKAHPELPKEIRRSTKTKNRCHALGFSRKMCIDFFIRLKKLETSPMRQPDNTPSRNAASEAFTFSVSNGIVQFHGSQSKVQDLELSAKLLQAVSAVLSANDAHYAAIAQPGARLPETPQRFGGIDMRCSTLGPDSPEAKDVDFDSLVEQPPLDAQPLHPSTDGVPCAMAERSHSPKTTAPTEQALTTPSILRDCPVKTRSADVTTDVLEVIAQDPAMAPESLANGINPDTNDEPVWLSEAIVQWKHDGAHQFSELTWRTGYAPTFRVMRELLGSERRTITNASGEAEHSRLDIRLKDITRQHIQRMHRALEQLPPNQGCNSSATTEAWERIAQREKKNLKLPSLKDVQKKFSHMRPFWTHAKEAKWISSDLYDCTQLVSKTVNARKNKTIKNQGGSQGYIALNPQELQQLFAHPDMTNKLRVHPWRYWVPLLGLYQGLRVSESTQIHVEDIQVIDGVHCLSFFTSGEIGAGTGVSGSNVQEYRRLKTVASRRVVPIHPKLIELGFLDFVEESKVRAQRHKGHLFSSLTWSAKEMFGRTPARFLSGLLTELGIHKPRKKVPHSLRSNFNQALSKTMLPSELVSAMMGHARASMKDKCYNETDFGPALPFASIAPFMEKMDFGLTHLTWAEAQKLG